MIRQVSLLLLVLFLTFQAVASPVRLTLRLEPPAELPGIPVTLHIEAENPSATPATVPNAVAMQVTPRNGERFVAVAAFRGEAGVTGFPDMRDPEITLAPGERRDLTIWAALDSVLLTRDLRLYEPGEYRLQLFVAPELRNLDYLSVGTLTGNEQLADPIVSNEAVLTVLTPKGDDAAVFTRIKSLSHPQEWSADLSEMIWSHFPNSHYAPYAVPNTSDRTRYAALLEAAIAKAPESLVADWHRLALAELRDDLPVLRNDDDLREAIQVTAYVRPLLEGLVERGRDPQLLEMAKKALSEVPTHGDLVRSLRINRGELTDIEPEIVCTSPYANGRFVAWLSYYNPAANAKISPVGERNKFTPPPFDRGQPTEFRPSLKPGVFKIVFDSPSATWHIDATNLRIDPKKTSRVCPADMDEFHEDYYRGGREWPEDDVPIRK